ncbi:hypothetical protein CLHOM_21040 [Clostridium homopropionicum DSM 5847]|uniref:Uncharacterized protein n=1 Tax=Clostridium homopropionicum DSM 5847 TaxID=1121318 RepID=A0A0L6Z943_9CLOT|nr:hypothetical protein [Clostridium homopropionicum]KOA19496.1 hypothetical protein CLHOM_21040 [Clostridium homopropionicum DSM 5847]SFG80988.1 hypothetical protein SAMN04488501_1188 [Clostridium homopropionicum]
MKIKSKTIIIAVFLIIPLILFLSSYMGFRSQKINNEHLESFKNNLMATIQQKSHFDMKNITPFEWDRMYIIRPYTSRTEMHEKVGTKWTTADTYIGYLIFDKTWLGEHPLDDDIFQKLVFVKDNKVVLDVTLNRGDADFTQISSPVINDNALFDIDKIDGRNIIKISKQ